MDPHKPIRGNRLKAWIAKHGGAVHCLVGMGLERDTKPFLSKQSHLSNCMNHGMAHGAASNWEKWLEPLGMLPGTLTNNLEETGLPDQIEIKAHGSVEAMEPDAKYESVAAVPLDQLVTELANALDQMPREGREAAGQALLTLCRAPDSRKAALDVIAAMTGQHETKPNIGQFRKQGSA